MRVGVLLVALVGWPAMEVSGQTTTPPGGAQLFGEGVFSTGAYELPPTFTPDGQRAYFTVSTPAYGRLHVIMESRRTGSGWSEPHIADFSGRYGDADPMISPDGSRLFFLSRRPAPARAPGRGDFDIWYLDRVGDGWGEPQHVPTASGPQDEHYAMAAADGTLYIAAIRPEGHGRGDLYRVPVVNGRYGEPVNLGPGINSEFHDTTPYVAPDQSYIIFSSWGRQDGNGPAGDLYISFRQNDSWSTPRNLGPMVNSGRTEYCPVVSHDGQYLYFASERGFADAPLTERLTTAELRRLLGGAGNGLGDTYRIEMSRILDAFSEPAAETGDPRVRGPAVSGNGCTERPWYRMTKQERDECGMQACPSTGC